MELGKRKAEEGLDQLIPVDKRPRTELVISEKKNDSLIPAGPPRTSSLESPTMVLTGHEGPVHSVKFNPSGNYLASASHDKLILLWEVYGECRNTLALKGHQSDVLDLQWSREGDFIFSASADKTGAVFDVETGDRIKRMRGHTACVNSVSATRRGEQVVATASDDCSAMIWDLRAKQPVHTLESEYQLLSIAFNDDGTQLFTGGIEEDIKCYDIRTGKVVMVLPSHTDSVTGLSLSPDGSFLLSNGMDQVVKGWDVRPYVATSRHVRQFDGLTHDFQKNMLRCSWSPDGTRISAGSSDSYVYVWDWQTSRVLYKLPGHAGAVSEVVFHPTEPIIASCGHDKKIFLGEIMPST